MLEETLESPLDCKENKPVNPKGNQSWIFIGRTDTEAETSILWPPDVKNWLTGKNPDARKDWSRMAKLDGITDSMDIVWASSRSWWWTGQPSVLGVHGVTKGETCLSNWTELNWTELNWITVFTGIEEKEYEKQYIYMYNWTFCCTPKTDTTL